MSSFLSRSLLSLYLIAIASPVHAASGSLLVPMSTVFDEIAHSQTITLCAFTLSPHGKTARMLEDAARRGARVSVTLDSRAFGSAETMNQQTIADFQSAGIRVHESSGALHLKAGIFDGQRIYLTDKNFTSTGDAELVLADPYPADRLLVERAMLGVGGSNDHLWLRKADALAAEASLINSSPHGGAIDVQTESFGPGTPVYNAMLARAQASDHVRLLVYRSELNNNDRERASLEELARAGVSVRVASTNEKIAIVGQRSFVGSSNATQGLPNQIDFGFYVGDPSATAQIQQHFNDNWDSAYTL
jgi:phosphatidylserine/phosphatidylglycerophosphate/cardiolipin synthase-like enzyme